MKKLRFFLLIFFIYFFYIWFIDVRNKKLVDSVDIEFEEDVFL